jgi:hypothetical protein
MVRSGFPRTVEGARCDTSNFGHPCGKAEKLDVRSTGQRPGIGSYSQCVLGKAAPLVVVVAMIAVALLLLSDPYHSRTLRLICPHL